VPAVAIRRRRANARRPVRANRRDSERESVQNINKSISCGLSLQAHDMMRYQLRQPCGNVAAMFCGRSLDFPQAFRHL
jgi:hypothetical protein